MDQHGEGNWLSRHDLATGRGKGAVQIFDRESNLEADGKVLLFVISQSKCRISDQILLLEVYSIYRVHWDVMRN